MVALSFNQRLGRWLNSFHFIGNPFDLYEADQERLFLPKCFVDRPYLHRILGNPASPQTAVLTASPGEGKSATREMVVYACQFGSLRGKALPVRYDDFSHLLNQRQPDQVRLEDHIDALARQVFKSLREYVPATYFDPLDGFDASLLLTFAERFADGGARLWLKKELSRAQPYDEEELNDISPVETLQNLVGLVCQLGPSKDEHYQSVYFLVDRVDEIRRGDPQAALQVLAPLVCESALINREKMAFKFFLPQEIGAPVLNMLPISLVKITNETIEWDKKELTDVLNQRVYYFSDHTIRNFEELCHPTLLKTAVDRLIDESDRSPRRLLRLCQAMVLAHLDDELENKSALLDKRDLTRAIQTIDEEDRTEQGSAPGRYAPVSATTPPERGFWIDPSEQIYLNGVMLPVSLSRQETTLLRLLLEHAPRLVETEDMIRAVWPESRDSSEDPKAGAFNEQNLRKLVDRLRDKLNAGQPDAPTDRFIKNVRGRGYWLDNNPPVEP